MKRLLLIAASTLFAMACNSTGESTSEGTEVSSGAEYTEDQWGQSEEGTKQQGEEQATGESSSETSTEGEQQSTEDEGSEAEDPEGESASEDESSEE